VGRCRRFGVHATGAVKTPQAAETFDPSTGCSAYPSAGVGKMRERRTPQEYPDLVDQTIFEIRDLLGCADDEGDGDSSSGIRCRFTSSSKRN